MAKEGNEPANRKQDTQVGCPVFDSGESVHLETIYSLLHFMREFMAQLRNSSHCSTGHNR
jgi:hypothetical protein